MVSAPPDTGEGTPPDTRFIEDGVCELLKTRRVLKCSYPYGFFLQQGSTQKEIFELMQVTQYTHSCRVPLVNPQTFNGQNKVLFKKNGIGFFLRGWRMNHQCSHQHIMDINNYSSEVLGRKLLCKTIFHERINQRFDLLICISA